LCNELTIKKNSIMSADEMLEEVIGEEAHLVAIDTINCWKKEVAEKAEEERLKMEEREKMKRRYLEDQKMKEKMLQDQLEEIGRSFIDEVVDSLMKEICKDEIRSQSEDQIAKEVFDEILKKTVDEEVEEISRSVLKDIQLDEDQITSQKILLKRQQQIFFRWKDQLDKVKKRRRLHRNFPATSTKISINPTKLVQQLHNRKSRLPTSVSTMRLMSLILIFIIFFINFFRLIKRQKMMNDQIEELVMKKDQVEDQLMQKPIFICKMLHKIHSSNRTSSSLLHKISIITCGSRNR